MSTPPTSGPIATAPPIVAPQTPNAVAAVACPGTPGAISASEVANIAAPPTPCRPRARFSSVGSPAIPQRNEAKVKIAKPIGEDAPAPEPVAERAGGEQEGGEGQRVGVDDPLQAREAGVEVALDVGQGDVDDRDVEQQHERRDETSEQGPPLALHTRGDL